MTLADLDRAVRERLREGEFDYSQPRYANTQEAQLFKALARVAKAAVRFSDADFVVKRWDNSGVCVVYREEVKELRKALRELAGVEKPGYFAIWSPFINDVTGVCRDKQDVLQEEPDSKFWPITKEQYERYRDDSKNVAAEIREAMAKASWEG
jgi:hypothetical protein